MIALLAPDYKGGPLLRQHRAGHGMTPTWSNSLRVSDNPLPQIEAIVSTVA
jgi:hypothetical protein